MWNLIAVCKAEVFIKLFIRCTRICVHVINMTCITRIFPVTLKYHIISLFTQCKTSQFLGMRLPCTFGLWSYLQHTYIRDGCETNVDVFNCLFLIQMLHMMSRETNQNHNWTLSSNCKVYLRYILLTAGVIKFLVLSIKLYSSYG